MFYELIHIGKMKKLKTNMENIITTYKCFQEKETNNSIVNNITYVINFIYNVIRAYFHVIFNLFINFLSFLQTLNSSNFFVSMYFVIDILMRSIFSKKKT